jgi:hypothetical protein
MASTYRDNAILLLLLSAIKGTAWAWFNNMFLLVRIEINQSLVLWYEKLIARFRKDPSIAYAKVDNILYRFGSENSDI